MTLSFRWLKMQLICAENVKEDAEFLSEDSTSEKN